MTLEWNPSLETGNAAIDEQHRTLVALFNSLVALDAQDGPDAVHDTLVELTAYIDTHFSMEEALMHAEEYPGDAIVAHMEEHRDLVERTRGYVIRYRQGGLTTISPLADFLAGWLCHHLREVDQLLARHIEVRRLLGA